MSDVTDGEVTAYTRDASVQVVEGEFREGGFHTVAVADKNNVWAVGAEGDILEGSQDYVILQSTDSGFSWTRKMLIASSCLTDIYFQNALTGWVVGSSESLSEGLILRTTDGGKSWIRQQLPVKDPNLRRVRFISHSTGWIVGSNGQVLRTTDGGTHWLRGQLPFAWINNEFRAWVTTFSFADELNGWVVGGMGQVYQSTDGGVNWQSRATQLSRIIKVYKPWQIDIREVRFFGKNLGCMIVQVNDKREPDPPKWSLKKMVILRTENGGRDWKVRRTLKSLWLSQAQFLSENDWWLQVRSGNLLHTTDGGKTWSEMKVDDPDRFSLHMMLFLDSNTGWLFSYFSGLHGTNLLTRDGGKTWVAQKIEHLTQ